MTNQENNTQSGDLGFEYRVAKNDAVLITHHGKVAATLRGTRATTFLEKMNGSSFTQQQQVMARITGNYKRGNERLAKNHPRNR